MSSRHSVAATAWMLRCAAIALGVFGTGGCAGSVQGAAKVAVSVKTCPEVQKFVGQAAADWQGSLGIDPGDAATLKAALQASEDLESKVRQLDETLKSSCSTLAADLGSPITAATGEEACARASQALSETKARLGSEATVVANKVAQCKPGCSDVCDVAAPKGPCAETAVSVTVSQTADEEAANRYRLATEAFLTSIVAVNEAQSNLREAIASARSAIELGLVTGQAVSDGDLASAAASAVCILPPLIRARERVMALRKNLRIMGQLAKLAGLELPRPPQFDEPGIRHANAERFEPATVEAPVPGRIVTLFSFPDGGLAAQTEQGVVALPGGQVLLRTRPEGQVRLSFLGGSGAPYCAVGAGRRAACIRSTPVFDGNGQQIGAQLILLEPGAERVVASVGARGSLVADGIAFNGSGQLMYAYTLSDLRGNQMYQVSRVARAGAEMQLPFIPDHAALEEIGGGRGNPPVAFVEYQGRQHLLYRDDRRLLLASLDRPGAGVEVAALSAYDARAVIGGDGGLYVFYYEPKSRTARVAYSRDGVTFKSAVLDTRESGWQLDAAASEDGAVAVYYYFRDTYRKGLRVASLHDGKLRHAPGAIMREDRWNAGWHPHLIADRNHEVWLTYLGNVEASTRVWAHFEGFPQLLASLEKPREDEDDQAKDWFLQVGVGGWYTWWNMMGDEPEPEDVDGAALHEASYEVDPALLFSANLEARFGPINVGLSYAQNYLDDATEKLGGTNRLLSGNLKIEELLPGHDVKVEGVWGRYHGLATREVDDDVDEELPIDTSYIDVHLFALNQWRIKYGLAFNRFTVPAPIVAYYAEAGQTQYSFATSALRDVSFNNIDLAVGYSKLDYLAKYENYYFGPILDATLAGGLSFVSFDALTTPAGDVESELALNARLSLQLGWLWMGRLRSLAGLGLYLRPSYVAEGGVISSGLSRPDAREEKNSKEADTHAGFLVYSLRHGPWLDAGVVW